MGLINIVLPILHHIAIGNDVQYTLDYPDSSLSQHIFTLAESKRKRVVLTSYTRPKVRGP